MSIKLPEIDVTEDDRLDTGNPADIVYTKDLFLEESPRLGCGLMVMKDTTFDWTLEYDEIDYIISGQLDILIDGRKICNSRRNYFNSEKYSRRVMPALSTSQRILAKTLYSAL